MRLLTFLLGAALLVPAFGQSVYKCPQPDGKVSYQAARCLSGNRMSVQDNGSGGDHRPIEQAAPSAKAPTTPEAAGLRPGEQRMLEQVQTREKEDRDRAAEYAKAAAIRDHQKAVEEMSAQMHHDHEQKLELMKNRYRAR